MALVARAVKAHRPQLVMGDGQGAMIALGLAKPLVLEATLALRNVDVKEAIQIGRAWGQVKGVIVQDPRVGRAGMISKSCEQPCRSCSIRSTLGRAHE